MRVLLATTWDTPCGIAEHSFYLREAVQAADAGIEILPSVEALDPTTVLARENWISPKDDLLHLNAHAALHSRWTPAAIKAVQALGIPVLVTWHDTGVPNSDQCKAVIAAADAAVVHEPFDDLPCKGGTRYWRMGVPDWSPALLYDQCPTSWCGPRPILGSIGFPFPWKNYDQLARVTGEAGWALYLIAPNATIEQMLAWRALNPHLWVRNDFVSRSEARYILAGCDATAFTYTCANTGQSGAILQGIATRKPVIAFQTCRQFRALADDRLGGQTIRWATSFGNVEGYLKTVPIQRVDPGIVALAEQDSWAKLGAKYAALYHDLAGA